MYVCVCVRVWCLCVCVCVCVCVCLCRLFECVRILCLYFMDCHNNSYLNLYIFVCKLLCVICVWGCYLLLNAWYCVCVCVGVVCGHMCMWLSDLKCAKYTDIRMNTYASLRRPFDANVQMLYKYWSAEFSLDCFFSSKPTHLETQGQKVITLFSLLLE